jgi:ferrous iron transport protein B
MSHSQTHVNKKLNSHSSQEPQRVALVGPPNSGKSTLFNWLTGMNSKTVNYAGSTVDIKQGPLLKKWMDSEVFLLDTPGTYSLTAKSADEQLTQDLLFSKKVEKIDKIILVLDSTQLSRHLLLAEQLKKTGYSIVCALTMSDLLKKNQIEAQIDLLEKNLQFPIVLVDGLSGAGVSQLIQVLAQIPPTGNVELPNFTNQQQHLTMDQNHQLASQVLGQKVDRISVATQNWDRFLLHPFWGLMFFVIVMFSLFVSVFWLATPFMDGIDQFFSIVNNWLSSQLAGYGFWADFLTSGVLSSFVAVIVFVPQIFILFFLIGLLESSGYLARAATLIDRPFQSLGMTGRSFVPLLSGFACAVPAMMATRTISSRRDRLITNFIIPLMTCSARLPVYTLLISFLFFDSPFVAAVFLTAIYFISLILGAIAAAVLNKILEKNKRSFFMMELPIYRRPLFKKQLKGALSKTQNYILKAGPAIFLFSVLVWVGTTFPSYQEPDTNLRMEQSYLAQLGQKMEPIFSPMGADWRVGVGLLSAFAARETFVSTLAILFHHTSDEVENQGLISSLQQAKSHQGQPLFTVASVSAIIVFFMIAMQCLSTFAIARKEESKKFAWIQLLSLNLIAYFAAVMTFQILS